MPVDCHKGSKGVERVFARKRRKDETKKVHSEGSIKKKERKERKVT